MASRYKYASEYLRECLSPRLLIFYWRCYNLMFINEYDYFINGVLKTSETTLKNAQKDIKANYTTHKIPKKNGERIIHAIKKDSDLYNLQKNLCLHFLDTIPLPKPVIGFVKDENYVRFLSQHIGKRYFLRLDINSFFDTINRKMLQKTFKEFFPGSDNTSLSTFIDLCTIEGKLPQGAVTSPVISNIVFRRIDQRILKYCQNFDDVYIGKRSNKESITYTRYADDLLFSSDIIDFSKNAFFMGMIISILKDNGFTVNKTKTRCSTNEISFSGFVLGRDVHLSRKKLHELNKVIYFFNKADEHSHKKYRLNKAIFASGDWLAKINSLELKGHFGQEKTFNTPEELLNYLCGFRSFLLLILRENQNDSPHIEQLSNKIHKLEEIIDSILCHI